MKSNIAIHTVSDSGHFPMMDNPKELYEVLKDLRGCFLSDS